MRRAAKVDVNQSDIVDAFRRLGATVQTLHSVGQGVPDLLVGYRGNNYLIEVKDGAKTKLTDDQVAWHNRWAGQVVIIRFILEVELFMERLAK